MRVVQKGGARDDGVPSQDGLYMVVQCTSITVYGLVLVA